MTPLLELNERVLTLFAKNDITNTLHFWQMVIEPFNYIKLNVNRENGLKKKPADKR